MRGSWKVGSWAVVLLVAVSGCSAIAVRPTPQHDSGAFECAGRLLPALDLASAGLVVLGGIAAGSSPNFDCLGFSWEPCQPRRNTLSTEAWIGVGAIGGLLAVSSVYGFWANHACQKELDATEDRSLRLLYETLQQARDRPRVE